MDFSADPDEAEFREEIRAFLRDNLDASTAARSLSGFQPSREDSLGWQKKLAAKGWSVIHWPKEHGGQSWSARKSYVFEEEMFLGGAPRVNVQGPGLVGPVIYSFGNDEQKRRFLPGIREGDTFWIQGFSEPEAGSDLASLRTRAVRDGDHYVVNGQKIWTSHGTKGDWNFVLVRTDPDSKKQAGISFLLIDVKTPGVTIRPIRSLDGGNHLAEVFYKDVRVPVENLVGEENKGWGYTKALLFNERAFYGAEAPLLKRQIALIKRYASVERSGDLPMMRTPGFAARLAELELELSAIEMSVIRVIANGVEDRNGGNAVGSILKVRGTELSQRLAEMLLEVVGDYGAYAYPDLSEHPELADGPLPGPHYAPGLMAGHIYRRAASIYGGTNEVQRNLIAKMSFGF